MSGGAALNDVTTSKTIGGLLGPTLIATVVSEFPLVQPTLYDEQIPPVVYLSGMIMFVAGLSIVRWHNLWRRNWTVLVTLSGWFLLALGLVLMFAAALYRAAAAGAKPSVFMVTEAMLFAMGLILSVKAYRRDTG